MASSSDKPPSSSFPTSLPAQQALVQAVRQELIKSQLVVLELNDRILQKETEKADAVAILGQAELVLEEKISHIMELDRVLNLRIRELESAAAKSTTDHTELKEQLVTLQAETNSTIADITNRLDQANREISKANKLAKERTAERDTERHTNTTLKLELKKLAAKLNTANLRAESAIKQTDAIQQSWVWKASTPFRVLFGPKP